MTKSKPEMVEPDAEIEQLIYDVIGAAIEVHRQLGPGFKERAYENAICVELRLRGISFERQVTVPLFYKGVGLGEGIIDLLVGSRLIVEIKVVTELMPIHTAQIISYLKVRHEQIGLLLNFNADILKHGIKRVINPYYLSDSLTQKFNRREH